MRILHVLASNRYSGAENVVCQIIGMFSQGEDIEMAYCSPDGQIRETLLERGYAYYPLKQLSGKELKRVLKEYKPDVIHAHDMRASFVVAKTTRRIPLVSHIHNNAFNSRGVSLKSIAYLLAGGTAKHIFWVSESSFKGYKFHNLFKKKSSVLYNVIDVDTLYKKMEHDKNEYNYDVVYVGRLTYQKNPERLIKVVAKVIQEKPDCKVAIVGTGELEDKVKNLAQELQIDKNIDFLGFLSNPLKIMKDSKVMLMTSRWEGTPMCALEAMALGLPIVSTPTDGLCELIVEGETGYLSDNDDVLVEKILGILMDDKERKALSESNKNRSKILNDVNTYKKNLFDIYIGK